MYDSGHKILFLLNENMHSYKKIVISNHFNSHHPNKMLLIIIESKAILYFAVESIFQFATWHVIGVVSVWKSSKILIHWGRVTQICVSNLTTIGSDNDLSPGRRQDIWTNGGILLIKPIGTNFGEILFEIHSFWFEKMQLAGKCCVRNGGNLDKDH